MKFHSARRNKGVLVILLGLLFAILLCIPSGAAKFVLGDMDGDGRVTADDAIYLLRHTLQPRKYPLRHEHLSVTKAAVAPTCVSGGLGEGKYCAICDEILVPQPVLPKGEHREGALIVDQAPTKTEQGKGHVLCAVCGENMGERSIAPIGSQGLAYSVNADGTTCTITGLGRCTEETVIYLPERIDGYTVVAVGEKAFAECKATEIVLSATVKTIHRAAFYKCAALREMTIPETVTKIGTNIFLGCTSLETVYYQSNFSPNEGETFLKIDSLKKVVFGDNLTRIPSYICYNCTALEEVILSSRATWIGNYAFYHCTSLTAIDLPSGLGNTGFYAFKESGLQSLILPEGVTSVENSFRDCYDLKTVVIPKSLIAITGQSFYCCCPETVFYMGDELDWTGVSIAPSSESITLATRYYYSEREPEQSGNYWRFVDGVPTVWDPAS